MMKNTKPEIRFKRFSEEWDERKLLDNIEKVVDFRGRTPKKLGLDWSETGYLALSALNVKNGYIDPFVDAHYGNQELYDKWMTGNELHRNQVLFTTEAPMGNVAQIPDEKRYILSQRTIAFNVNYSLITEDFLAAILGSPKMFIKLSSLSSGGTAKGVSQKSLATVDLWLSKDVEEQTQIGNFFKNLDSLITLLQQKYNKLVNVKKAMLEKMFPKNGADVPEIRFKGFSGAWEEKELSCIVSRVSCISNKVGLPRVEYEDIVSGKGELNKNIEQKNSLKIGIEFEIGDVLYGKLRPYLNNWLLPTFQGIAVGDFWVFRPNETNSKFIFYLIQTSDYEKKANQSSGSKMPRADWNLMSNAVFFIPLNKEEQEKIGNYFKNLDKLLTLHQGELGKLKNLKKAMLEKMFV